MEEIMKNKFKIGWTIILITAMLASCGGAGETDDSDAAVTTLAGTAGSYGSDDGTGTAALFNSPSAITTDGTNLYVADSGNNTIRKIVISTKKVSIFAGSTNGDSGSDDGIGTTARFNNPLGVTTDGTNLYVADYSNHTIRKIVIASRMVTTLAGTAGSYGSDDGTGTAASFYNPFGIATDGTILYVADYGNHTIRKIVIASGEVTTLAGTAGAYGSDNGAGTAARFYYPAGIATDGTDLYLADTGNHIIRKIVIATGEVTTLAGKAGSYGSANGTGTAARFNNPFGITMYKTNLYAADTGNSTIRKIVIATGKVTTLAGSAEYSGSTDETGTAARFNNPFGITMDENNLYVADTGNHTIRKIHCD
jgi:sugar lactone lactonase YvrE